MNAKCTCGKLKKAKHTMCRACFLGPVAFKEEKARLKVVRTRSHTNNRWRRRRGFQCEMGYSDCEARGWCNGDC